VVNVLPYDSHVDGEISLRGNPHEIGRKGERRDPGGRPEQGRRRDHGPLGSSHLAYAPEIANAMLRAAGHAVIAARTRIVEGARVACGRWAASRSSRRGQHIVNLDEERKAAMVSNLLVVLCSEHETQPVGQCRHALPGMSDRPMDRCGTRRPAPTGPAGRKGR